MNVASRGVRNAFRNQTRTVSITLILSLSIGLALSMLLAHKAVDQKIQSVKSSVGNTITISPAGVRGFDGGGNPLTQSQLDKVQALPNVSNLNESLNDRLASTDTNLLSSIDLGQLGQRFAARGGFGGSTGGGANFNSANATPPVTVIGTTNPTDLASTQGGGTFSLKSGKLFNSNSTDNVALVGQALATKNNLSVGSTFTAYNTQITVVGIFDSGNQFSNGLLMMPLATEQKLSSQAGAITSAVVTVNSVDNLSSTTQAIKNTLGTAADVTSAQDREQAVVAPLENVKTISVYSLIGAVAAGAVIILLTMIMIVRERRREIGVLKAIGASNLKVSLQFVAEAVTFTLLAAVIGIIIGVVAGNPITNALVKNSSSTSTSTTAGGGPVGFAGTQSGFRGGGGGRLGFQLDGSGLRQSVTNIHTAVGWSLIIYGLLTALVIAIVGSSFAAWSIAKVRPAEVMRSE